MGLRGAETCLHDIDVDMAVAVDTFLGLQPDVNMRDLFYEVGRGAGLHVGEQGDKVGSEPAGAQVATPHGGGAQDTAPGRHNERPTP
jgi:hypothetical protein